MTKIPLRITVLGSGTSTGVPTIGCRCPVCRSLDPRNKRLRTSILITRKDTGQHILIDTSPDLRQQMIRANVRDLQHVLYTHTHADHTHGFDDLRAFFFHSKKAVQVFLSEDNVDEFKVRFAYAFMPTGYLGITPQIDIKLLADNFEVIGLPIQRIRLPHGHVLTNAFRIGSFAFATDFKEFGPAEIAAWQGAVEIMIASGLRFSPHPTHSTIDETIALFDKLAVKHGIITHLSHDVDYARDSPKLPHGYRFAYDGMTISVDVDVEG